MANMIIPRRIAQLARLKAALHCADNDASEDFRFGCSFAIDMIESEIEDREREAEEAIAGCGTTEPEQVAG